MSTSLGLDHFFILTDPGAPQAELLSDIGLIEGSRNDHSGQGTSNRRFFFANSMLELLYVRDVNEAVDGPGSRLHIVERIKDDYASPFGLIFKSPSNSSNKPFSGWRYYPSYLHANEHFLIGENSELLEEPLCVYVPFDFSMTDDQPQSEYPFTNVTEIRMSVPVREPSSTLEKIGECESVSLQIGKSHLLEVIINNEKEGQYFDFRPQLPLNIRY